MPKLNFRVGDRVRMSPHGKSFFMPTPRNPHGLAGTVHDVAGASLLVKWDNDTTNGYSLDDVQHVFEDNDENPDR